ncbi:MAG: LPS export ABC transporter periplasmic protein LptC [Candidatus Hydrogenedentes bacterium]|nr:LPS export ABC transporter periplasmic protein LptC [Candidatus Hydrogenedentota bacterium]
MLRGQAADAEEIILDAAEGSYEENQRAYLKGGVRAQVADMTLQLEDMEVTTVTPDSPGMAFTEHPVTITAPGMELRAENLRLYPDEKKMELSQCSGFIEFGRLQP